MGYPSAIGILWNAADRVALRPEFTWTRGSTDSPTVTDPILGTISSGTSSDNWQTGVGISALLYVARYDNLRTYLTPRIAYSRLSASSNVSASPVASSNTTTSWSTSGSFGLQYTVGRHFGVFGETGLNYQASTSETTLIESRTIFGGIGAGGVIMTTTSSFTVKSESRTHSFSSRSGVGVIFFF
jgi:hypothetical protein